MSRPALHRLFLISFFGGCGIAVAQTEIRGTVTEASAIPIPFCNVFIERAGVLNGLTSTDEDGRFTLQPEDTGTYLLVVTSIGYKKYREEIFLGPKPAEVKIVLYPDTVLLGEVVVRGQSPVQTKGDTVIFDAAYFSQGDEVILADLLKKLPGITVGDNGKVKFQGRDVSRIKVENDDLFDSNYQILSRNLSADLVEQVEVLQHYSDNPLLKNLEDSEEIALNLTLKKDSKRRWSGDARMETNLHERYDARANLISLREALKLYAMASANNTGSDPAGEADGMLEPPTSRLGSQAASGYLVPLLNQQIPEFKRDRYFFNQAAFGSLHGVSRPAKGLKVSLGGYAIHDLPTFRKASRTLYYAPTDTIEFDEWASTSTDGWLGLVRAAVDAEASPRTTFRYRAVIHGHTATTTEASNLNQNEVAERLVSETSRHDQLLTITHKISEQAALTVDLRYLSDHRPQAYLVDGNLVGNYFGNVAAGDTLRQNSDVPTRFWGAELNLYRRTSSGKLGLRIGYDYLAQAVETDLSSLVDLSRNRLSSTHRKSHAEGYYAWRRGSFIFTPGASVEWVDVRVDDRTTSPFLFVNPRLGIRWQLSAQSRLSFLYSMSQTTSSTTQLAVLPFLTDYNLLAVNDSGFRSFASQTLLATYDFGNWNSGFNFFVTVFHKEMPLDYLPNSDIETNFVVTTTNRVANRDLSSVSVNLDRYFKFARTNLKVNWTFSRSTFTTSTESVTVPGNAHDHKLDVSLRSAFSGPWNAHVGHEFRASATCSNLIAAANYRSLLYVDGYFNGFQRRLLLSLHGERYALISIPGSPVFYFVDFTIRYSPNPARRLTILLKGRNILDETVFGQRFVTPQSVVTEANRLIPRYILAGIEFRF